MASTPPELIPVTVNSIPIAPFAERVSGPNGCVETSPEVALFLEIPCVLVKSCSPKFQLGR